MVKSRNLFLLLLTPFVAFIDLGMMCDPPPPQWPGIEPTIINFDTAIDYKAFIFYVHIKDTTFSSVYHYQSAFSGGIRADYQPVDTPSFSKYVGDTSVLSLVYSNNSTADSLILDTFAVAPDHSMHWVCIGHQLPYQKDSRQPSYSKRRLYGINGKLDTLYYYAFF
jgi:hypothetical protein